MTRMTTPPASGRAAPVRDRILEVARDLVLRQGFGSTTVQQVLTAAGASKGAFFHHFPTKDDLGRELVARYAAADAAVLDAALAEAESTSEDPAVQLVSLLRAFEEAADGVLEVQPSCLFVSFIYEHELADPAADTIVADAILHWRTRILERLEQAAIAHPPPIDVDLSSLADHVFTTFEGAFLLARALDEPTHLRAQLALVRQYLQLLFGVTAGSG